MIDESLRRGPDRARLGPAGTTGLDVQDRLAAAASRVGAIGSPRSCLEWPPRGHGRGATDDEIADVLLAIAPVVGLGRVVCAAAGMATAPGYDIAAALEEPDGQRRPLNACLNRRLTGATGCRRHPPDFLYMP